LILVYGTCVCRIHSSYFY